MAGIYQTVAEMKRQVNRGKILPPIRVCALNLINDLPQKARVEEINALFTFVQKGIRYVRDVQGVETVQSPDVTLKLRQGDCDDKSTLLASLLASIGYRTRFVIVGFRPGRYSHVYLEVENSGVWYALDATEPHPAGWEPPYLIRKVFPPN